MNPNTNPCDVCGYPAGEGGRCSICAAGPPALKSGRSRFLAGFRFYFSGIRFLLNTPRTKRYVIAPITISLLIFSISVYFLWNITDPLREWLSQGEWMPDWLKAIVAFLVGTVTAGILLILVWFTAAGVTAAVAAPFLDILVGRVDEVKTGKPRIAGGTWLADLAFTAIQSGVIIIFIIIINIVALAIAWIPPVGAPVSFVLLTFGAGLGALDVAASRRRWTFSQKMRVASANISTLLGFGTAAVLIAFVPCVGWMLTIPVSAAGGTLMLYGLDLSRARSRN
ncbi:MAG: EI24 domain-containing protein [Planctomycetota bacterium]